MSDSEILVDAQHVGKKFCRSLKRSLYYGAGDIAKAVNPFTHTQNDIFEKPVLRKKEFWAVQDVSFQLRRGDCLGLLGHNGAGKSTLLKILNNLIKPDTGQIIMRGRVCALIELGAGFNPILTGRENIYNSAALFGIPKKVVDQKFDEIVAFSELEEFIDTPLQNYSSGMRVRLGFAVAIQMEPDVLLLDEVLAVGDIAFRIKCLNAMFEILKHSAVIFVSHSMSQIHRICNQVCLLSHGQTAYLGNDVGEGVHKYFQLAPNQKTTQIGDGSISVDDIKVLRISPTGKRESISELSHGDTLEIEFYASSKKGPVDCNFSMVVWNSELYPIDTYVDGDAKPHKISLNGEPAKFIVRAESIKLAAGLFSVSFHFTQPPHNKVLSRIDGAASFTMKGQVQGQASQFTTTTLTKS
ncbi:polysaccharide ABC transporter ATP-binding protein [Cerasicoccus maritimus]|uniref:ABC transporter ATP-binding protein n=1 Tax=Cerasicoccus maritimus TaxID=490089 RepID=UPI0028528952|nr:ABC transporter ATP-binding protein [Cerasicoccus maritimus]